MHVCLYVSVYAHARYPITIVLSIPRVHRSLSSMFKHRDRQTKSQVILTHIPLDGRPPYANTKIIGTDTQNIHMDASTLSPLESTDPTRIYNTTRPMPNAYMLSTPSIIPCLGSWNSANIFNFRVKFCETLASLYVYLEV